MHVITCSFLYGCWGSNSGHHPCSANTLPLPPTPCLILMPRSGEPSAIDLGGVKHPLLKRGSPLILSPKCASCLCSLLVGKSRDPCPQVDFPSPILLPQFTPISSLSDYRAEWDPSYENYPWNKLQPYFPLLIFLPQRCTLHHLKDPFV